MPVRIPEAIACLVWLCAFGHPGAPPPVRQSEIPFKLQRGVFILVQAALGRMDALTLVLDTGASRTVLDTHVTRALDLSGRPTRLFSFNRSIDAEEVLVPPVRLGPLQLLPMQVLAADLSLLESLHGLNVDGILGADSLRGTCISIDYAARRLRFESGGRWDAAMPFNRESPYPVVNLVIDETPFRVLVDTGADGLVLYESAVPRSWAPRIIGLGQGSDAAGNLTLRSVRTGWIWLGLTSWRNRLIYITPGAGPDPSFYDGVLSPVSLGIAQLQLDFERLVLRWNYKP